MPKGDQTPGAGVLAFELANQDDAGIVQFFGTSDSSARYDAADFNGLNERGLAFRISSAQIFTPQVGSTTLIFYSYGHLQATHFDNTFLLLENNSGDVWNVDLQDIAWPWWEATWQDQPSSLIVAHTKQKPEQRISAQQSLTPLWNSFLDQQLSQAAAGVVSSVSRDGNPSWAWVPFPIGIEHLNPSQNYLRAHQKLNVALDDPLPDYTASITFYLRLFVTPSNRVSGVVQRWENWVEAGLLTDFVASVLKPWTIVGVDNLNAQLAAGTIGPPFTVKRLYYLPGNQTTSAQTGKLAEFMGMTEGDATVVFQTS